MSEEPDRFTLAARAAVERSPQCLTPEDAVMFADGLLDTEARRRAADHLEGCGRCRAEVLLYCDFRSAEARPEEAAALEQIQARLNSSMRAMLAGDAPPRRNWTAWRWHWPRPALAAAAALTIAAGISLYFRPGGPPRVDPTGVGEGVLRSAVIALVSPVATVADAPREFRWEPVRNATRYRIELTELDRTLIWSSEVNQASIVVPEAIERRLRGRTSYQWHVEAFDAAGVVIARSNLQNFHID